MQEDGSGGCVMVGMSDGCVMQVCHVGVSKTTFHTVFTLHYEHMHQYCSMNSEFIPPPSPCHITFKLTTFSQKELTKAIKS